MHLKVNTIAALHESRLVGAVSYSTWQVFFDSTCAKEVLFSSAFIYLLVSKQDSLSGNVAHRPRKKRLRFGGNPDNVTLGLRLRLGALFFNVTHTH